MGKIQHRAMILYLIRNCVTGLYWKGTKKRFGRWTESPAKAWHSWQRDQVDRTFMKSFPDGAMPAYEIVAFSMRETSASELAAHHEYPAGIQVISTQLCSSKVFP